MAEEAAGRSPALSFPAWVARTRHLHQEAQRYPCGSLPARASTRSGGAARRQRGCAVRTPQPWRAKGGPVLRGRACWLGRDLGAPTQGTWNHHRG